jgi:abelson tyrosine-protein kinase 1
MAGQGQLTTEVDVYAFAICCVEILSMGSLPWAHAMDEEDIRQFVLGAYLSSLMSCFKH